MLETSAFFNFLPESILVRYLIFLGVIFVLIFVVKYLSNALQWATEKVLNKNNFIGKSWLNIIIRHKLFSNIFFAIGLAFLTSLAAPFIKDVYPVISAVILRVMASLVIICIMLALNSFLSVLSEKFSKSFKLPIKGLVQAAKIIFWCITIFFVVATMINKHPMLLLGGLTALSAVIMLVFKDSIMGLVSGFQLSLNDLVRVGDWIEIPSQGADGDVIDIMLTTVRVRNWDNTIVNVPAYELVAHSFKNWRGMSESGGRRIKRSITVDLTTVRFLENKDIEKLKKITLIKDYLEKKEKEIEEDNKKRGEDADNFNARRLSNVGTFRRYCFEYLKQNPNISDKFTCMVRQLEPHAEGLPLEIYAFSSNTNWVAYEDIQSDIFDHFLSIISLFDLKVYQRLGDYPDRKIK